MFELALTKENIFSKVDEYTLFRTYCTPFKDIDVPFSSELREDTKPSCRITYDGKLWYKDFGNGKKAMDIIQYICEKYSCNFKEALNIINRDFSLGFKGTNDIIHIPEIIKPVTISNPVFNKREDKIINVGRRNWNKKDIEFWNQFGISLKTLTFFRVFPIKYYVIKDSTREIFIKTGEYSYCFFITREDSIDYLKIYSPFDDFKWITNCRANHFQGYDQLPWLSDLLIITKSMKDVMVLYEYGYNAIAPQSENIYIDTHFFNLLKKRFNRVIVFFDNDEAGIKANKKLSNSLDINYFMLPIELGAKDISDYVKSYGFDSGKIIIKQLIDGINIK